MTDSSHHHHDSGTGSGLVSPFWKYGSFVLGFGLVLAIGGNSGPASARAGDGVGNQVLAIGGFDAIEGQPGFVIVDGSGVRVGTLPMVVGDDGE